ncbi:MAG: glycine dehydrogenase, partial [Rhodospirillaceae bacterium]
MRYLPLTEDIRREMLDVIGVSSIDDLFRDLPKAQLAAAKFDLPATQSEIEVERSLSAMAARNMNCGDVPVFLGAGNYRHHTPAS